MSTLLLTSHHHTSSLWPPIVSFLGITYFLAWSLSFYPQLLLNYRRKRTDGLSSDFVYLNPLGFLALSIWNFGMLYSPLARSQYANRHDGNIPQVAIADLAFSGHAFVLAAIALGQVWYYRKRTLTALEDDKLAIRGDGEREPLLSSERERGKKKDTIQDPAIPSLPCQIGLGIMFLFAIIIAILVKTGTYNLEYLDWLYAVSMIKLAVSAVKYAPQIIVNYKLKEVEGMAIEGIIADIIGSVLSFAQLVISSVFIAHDPSGITANPAKLGLSGLSATFDTIILAQKYIFFRKGRQGGGGTR